jgi:prepilin-type processing-associated H-X9-DG protein
VDDKENAKVREVRIKVFESPLDVDAQPNPKWGATSYQANAGSKTALRDNDGVFWRDSALQLTDIEDGTANTMAYIETLKGDGGTRAVTVARQHVRLDKKELKGLTDDSGVKDFKANKNIAGDRGSSWMDGRFLQASLTGTRAVNDSRPDVDCGGEGGLSAARTSLSGVNVLFCDGSVRMVSTSVTLKVWQAICTRSGGETLPADF